MNTNAEKRDPALLIATTNRGKVSEIRSLLQTLNYRVISLLDLPHPPSPVEETGKTFAENALLKAEYYHTHSGLLTIADDSGLEVDALDGRPGIYSARYGGPGLSSEDQIQLLLEEMKDVPEEKRTARFVCAIALAGLSNPKSGPKSGKGPGADVNAGLENNARWPSFRHIVEDRCEGKIAFAPCGAGGFGYDPIFIDAEIGQTFAEMSDKEKSARSHRGKALRAMRKYLEALQEASQ
jgi:XTP/dITP diphosphohydrolase